MAAPAKKREIDEKSKENEEMNSSDDNEMDTNDEQGTQIMVDFVGRIPEDPDFNGIKLLLQQLFLKAKVETSELANFIIERNYMGSVVKQGGDDDDDEEEDEDDDENDVNDVFGITTVINISHGQSQDCIKQLRKVLADYSSDYASDTTNALIKSILDNDSAALGLIINERFVNIPADIAVPLLENLISDMKRAVTKKMPYDFQYYVLISKLYKPKNTPGKKMKKKKSVGVGVEEPELMWSNPEEEIFAEDAMCSFEFSVDKDSDTSAWADDDEEMVPHRRVMLFEAAKLPSIIEKIKKELAH